MITKELLKQGLKNKVIRLKNDPNMEHGTVAEIGNYWFYFGGRTALMNPDEYRKTVTDDELADSLYAALEDLKEDVSETEYAYYEAVLREAPVRRWMEIRCTHLDTETGFWAVDAWKTDADEEEAEVIAYIDDFTGRVIYTDPLARVDSYAQEVICEKIRSLGAILHLERKPSAMEIQMPTYNGQTFCVEFEPNSLTGSGDDAIYIGVTHSNEPYVYDDLLSAKADEKGIRLYVWDDITDEDWQHKFEIPKSDIDNLIDSCREVES